MYADEGSQQISCELPSVVGGFCSARCEGGSIFTALTQNPRPVWRAYDVRQGRPSSAADQLLYSSFSVSLYGTRSREQRISLANDPTGACTTKVAIGVPCPQTYGGTITAGTTIPAANLNGMAGPVYPTDSPGCTAATRARSGIDPNSRYPTS